MFSRGVMAAFSRQARARHPAAFYEYTASVVETVKKNLSPYDLSPANDNPMRRLLTELIDFGRLRLQHDIQLTVSATNARTARRRVFTNQDVSVDALLASACLPQFFRAVEIDGEPYWDGTLTGNPAFGPLLTKRPDCDLIIVRVDPINAVSRNPFATTVGMTGGRRAATTAHCEVTRRQSWRATVRRVQRGTLSIECPEFASRAFSGEPREFALSCG
jgi:predicted acylesterase/phospholipase RssA